MIVRTAGHESLTKWPRAIERPLVAFAIVLGVALCIPTPCGAAELITLPTGTTVATLPADANAIIVYPFTAAPTTKDLKPAIVALLRDGQPVSAPEFAAVEPSITGGALRLAVDVDALPRAGAYTATVRLTAAGGAEQLIVLTLTRPSANVTARAKIVVEREVWFPEVGFGPTSEHRPQLRLTAGKDTRVLDLSTVTADGDDDVTVSIPGYEGPQPTRLDPALVSGGSLALSYAITGEVPLGTSTRSVQIHSGQLTDPVTVSFEIKSTRNPALIGVLIILGLMLGLITRRVLVRIRSSADVVEMRSDLQVRLAALLEKYADPDLRAALKRERSLIRDIGWRWKPEKAQKFLGESEQRANSALGILQTQLEALATSAKSREVVIDRDLTVPKATAEELERARRKLRTIRRLIEDGNGDAAESSLNELDQTNIGNLARTAKGDAAALHQALGAALQVSEPWSATFSSVTELIERADTELAAVQAADLNLEAPSVAHRVLGPLDKATREVQLQLRLQAANTFAFVEGALQRGGIDSAPVRAAIDSANARLAMKLEARDRAAEAAVAFLAVQTAIRAALRAEVTGEAEKANIDTALATGDVEAALGVIAQATGVPEMVGDVGGVGAPAVTGTGAPPETLPAPLNPEFVSPTTEAPLLDRVDAFGTQAVARTVGFLANAVRYVLLSALLVMVAYRWFAQDWVGDIGSMALVLTWAFGIDLSVEVVQSTLTTKPTVLNP